MYSLFKKKLKLKKMNFQDPATSYCFNLISVHHDVFWFIIMILSVVYWSLYKILKEFGWNSFNKHFGFFRYIVYSFSWYLILESGLLAAWFKFFLFFFNNVYKVFIIGAIKSFDSRIRTHPKLWTGYFDDFVIFLWHYLFGKEYFEGFSDNSFKFSYEEINYLVEKKYSNYLCSNYSANAFLFYDRRENFLNIQNFRHSTKLEYLWGIFPTAIIVLILLPSMFLLYSMDDPLDPNFTIKIIGHQWFWSYEFEGIFTKISSEKISSITELKNYNFDSVLVQENDLLEGENRLLEVDNRLILPLNNVIRFIITSGDVIHSWASPNLGIKVDAIPGRLNQFISLVCHPGVFYGQCSELCGIAHAFMPIAIQAVPHEIFLEYLNLGHLSENRVKKAETFTMNEAFLELYRSNKVKKGFLFGFVEDGSTSEQENDQSLALDKKNSNSNTIRVFNVGPVDFKMSAYKEYLNMLENEKNVIWEAVPLEIMAKEWFSAPFLHDVSKDELINAGSNLTEFLKSIDAFWETFGLESECKPDKEKLFDTLILINQEYMSKCSFVRSLNLNEEQSEVLLEIVKQGAHYRNFDIIHKIIFTCIKEHTIAKASE